jgi:hypothetical protein
MLEDKRRFWTFLEWGAERPGLREKLVKTGWKSWKEKWREKAGLHIIQNGNDKKRLNDYGWRIPLKNNLF